MVPTRLADVSCEAIAAGGYMHGDALRPWQASAVNRARRGLTRGRGDRGTDGTLCRLSETEVRNCGTTPRACASR